VSPDRPVRGTDRPPAGWGGWGLVPSLATVMVALSLGGVVLTAVWFERGAVIVLEDLRAERAAEVASLGARLASPLLATDDRYDLYRLVDGLVTSAPHTWFAAAVWDAQGRVVVFRSQLPGWEPEPGPPSDRTGADDDLRASVRPAEVDGAVLGWFGVYYDQAGIKARVVPVHRALWRVAALLMAVSVAVSMVAAARISGPIRRLDRVVARVSDGDFTVRADETAWGEAGRLAKGVNGMLDRIEALVSEVRRAEAASRRAEELESLAHLGGGLAHEIKNPLTTVRLLLESMGREAPEGASRLGVDRQDLDLLAGQVAKIDAVLEEFVRFARPRPLRPAPVDLEDLVGAVAGTQAVAARQRGVRIQVYPGPPVRVTADRQRLEQALTNLVANALAHSPPQGTVRLGWSADGDRFALWVEDEGRGIPEEFRSRVFEPFFTQREGGLGLGLSIARSAVLQHGWDIDVEAPEQRGARFVIRGAMEAQEA